MGKKEEEDETYFPLFRAMENISAKISKKSFWFDEEKEEERNDVYIYQTLRYPPNSTPPTAN